MLAPKNLEERYIQWNAVHGAPFGRPVNLSRIKRLLNREDILLKKRGPFSIQANNSTRRFEYPWAYDALALEQGGEVLEVGGGLSGFQFVLSQEGCRVVNVDPGMDEHDWPCNQDSIQKMNRLFGTNVELCNSTIDQAGLETERFDRACCISVIEHLPQPLALDIMRHVYAALKPGGLFVLTCDLFLNVAPFTTRQQNEFGGNQNIRTLIDPVLWNLQVGDPEQLYGFDRFSVDKIMFSLETFLIGAYPTLTQCLVLEKR